MQTATKVLGAFYEAGPALTLAASGNDAKSNNGANGDGSNAGDAAEESPRVQRKPETEETEEEESQESAAQSALAQRQPAEKEPPSEEANHLEEPLAQPPLIQRQPDHVPASVKKALQLGDGRPMNRTTRASMEQSFGADLSEVRVHTSSGSVQAAHDINAKAFTSGQDIHFGEGQYQPGTRQGQKLLAHELAHTIQQRSGQAAVQSRGVISQPGEPLEREADAVASRIDGNQAVTQPSVGAGATHRAPIQTSIQRQVEDSEEAALPDADREEPGREQSAERESVDIAPTSLPATGSVEAEETGAPGEMQAQPESVSGAVEAEGTEQPHGTQFDAGSTAGSTLVSTEGDEERPVETAQGASRLPGEIAAEPTLAQTVPATAATHDAHGAPASIGPGEAKSTATMSAKLAVSSREAVAEPFVTASASVPGAPASKRGAYTVDEAEAAPNRDLAGASSTPATRGGMPVGSEQGGLTGTAHASAPATSEMAESPTARDGTQGKADGGAGRLKWNPHRLRPSVRLMRVAHKPSRTTARAWTARQRLPPSWRKGRQAWRRKRRLQRREDLKTQARRRILRARHSFSEAFGQISKALSDEAPLGFPNISSGLSRK